jgi:hypothetical protein
MYNETRNFKKLKVALFRSNTSQIPHAWILGNLQFKYKQRRPFRHPASPDNGHYQRMWREDVDG